MLARGFRLSCRHVYAVTVLVLLVPVCVDAQTGRVTLQAKVSETVALSVQPSYGDINVQMVSNGSGVRITASGDALKSPVIQVPLLVRSNSGFRISAVFESKTAELTQLSVVGVRAAGPLVSPQAVNALKVTPGFDRRVLDNNAVSVTALDVSRPIQLLSGPRVSLGGTLNSPNNALEVTLLISVKSQTDQPWSINLLLVGSAEPLIQ